MSKESGSSSAVWRAEIAAEIRKARKTVVLAVGHPSRGDDAAGLRCGEELKRLKGNKARARLKVIFGFETPESATGEIRRADPDLVLIIDSARAGRKPGDIFIVEKDEIADEDVSTHRLSLKHLVTYLEKTIGCRALIIGIEPQSTDPGDEVSAAVRKSAASLARFLWGQVSASPSK